jgi:hypothetical protein
MEMAAPFELKNINIATISILTIDAAGDKVPPISGDVFSVVSSDPTKMTAAMGVDATGNPAIVLTPLVRLAPGLTATVSDTSALTSDVQIVDIVNDVTPAAVSLDLASATFATQPMPAA